ncbi:hypothetical protein KUV23_13805 [Algoriphagus marincola]|uniref:Metal-dependent phosphohydrolase 7TM extracellular domain-containing protein n=1 Tax=Algoriphagus marincola TaxID=264027 RepID=A0ABS7N6V7_9BACT|nr:hypothetical protein [Algoriphagus marincola]MBY5952059.1 hypothetical protein [Algoriphagus marincola]
MPLEIENIDKKAALPEGIDFRKELIWEKIKTQKKSKLRVFWPWMVAALVILGFGLSFLKNSKLVEITGQEIDLIVSNSVHDFPELENPVLEFQVPDLIEKRIPVQKTEVKEIKIEPGEKERISDEIPIFKSIVAEPVKPLEIATNEQLYNDVQEEKKLSPAATRLQRNINKVNPNITAEQSLVADRFDLIKTLQIHSVYASSKNTSNTSLNSLLHGKIHQN